MNLVPAGLRLEQALCAICESDDAAPVAVGEDFAFRTSDDSFLAVRCRHCGLVYLDPRPSPSEIESISRPLRDASDGDVHRAGIAERLRRRIELRRLRSWLGDYDENATVVDVGGAGGSRPTHLRALGYSDVRQVDANGFETVAPRSADVVLAIGALEHALAPLELLSSIRRMLRPGGRAIIVTVNTDSVARALFGGRHWSGYDFPRCRTFFDRATFTALAVRAGMRVRSTRSLASAAPWTASIRNVLVDLGAPAPLRGVFSTNALPALALFTVLDSILTLADRGALLHAVTERP